MGTKNKLRQGLPHFVAIPFEMIDDPAITDVYHIAVYAAIRRYADFTTGTNCFPAIETIVAKARCSERKVHESIKELETAGWIDVTRGKGRGQVNHYCLRLKKRCRTCTLSGENGQERVQEVQEKGAPGAPYLETLPRDNKNASVDATPHSSKKSIPAKNTDMEHPHNFLVYLFSKKYSEGPGLGKNPPWAGKHTKLLKDDLARLGFDRLLELIELFFDSPPRDVANFAAKAGWTYNIFHSLLPQLEAAKAEQKARFSLLRVCPHCHKEQEHNGADCLFCYKPLNVKEAAHAS